MQRLEYPRPQLKRKNYQVLNGNWNFDFDDENRYLNKYNYHSLQLNKRINVPFTYQTKLSGINDLSMHEILWYEKLFDLNDDLKGKNVLLNFNAVDFHAIVFLNGKYLGEHWGGYTSFDFDVSDVLKERDNHLVVRVFDPYDPNYHRGKQYWEKEPSRCWYTPNSGIWQSVWLESYVRDYLDRVLITPDIDKNTVRFEIFNHYGLADVAEIEIFFHEKLVKKVTSTFDNKKADIEVKIQEEDYIDEIHFWDIDNPNLYDVKIFLKKDNVLLDEVDTYFGFRKIHTDKNGNIYLNNRKLYQKLILDQGYFEDSDITPPSAESLKNDILIAKKMGFNGARKHQKIEDPYFYYYADKLGFLVWAEIPSAYNFSLKEIDNMTLLTQDVIIQLYNHPSIITWVPFNESWGIRKALIDNKQQNFVRSIYYLIKAIDTTRLVDSNDGWEQINETDIIAIHDYDSTGDSFYEKFKIERINDVQPMGRKLISYNQTYQNQGVILSEYGGLSILQELDKNYFGYHISSDKEKFIEDLKRLQKNVYKCSFNGFCYTQLTDVKQEKNGLLDSKHMPKFDVEVIRKIMDNDYEN